MSRLGGAQVCAASSEQGRSWCAMARKCQRRGPASTVAVDLRTLVKLRKKRDFHENCSKLTFDIAPQLEIIKSIHTKKPIISMFTPVSGLIDLLGENNAR
jgi:hypothetical protein